MASVAVCEGRSMRVCNPKFPRRAGLQLHTEDVPEDDSSKAPA